jgi:phage terminase large subunit-like protein
VPRIHIDFEAIKDLPEGAREAALSKAQEMLDLQRTNPLEGYNPYFQQAQLHQAATDLGCGGMRGFFGGNRAGKTTAGIVDDLLEMVPRELIPGHLQRWKRPDWKCPRYIRVGNVSGREIRSILLPKFQEWTPKQLLGRRGWRDAYNRDDSMIRLECGCTAQLLSYELDREKWGGSALHRMHFDEEPPEELYEEGAARLVDFNGDELFTMTPLLGMTWMFDRVWLAAAHDPSIFTVIASMVDNPNISREGVLKAYQKYKGSPEMLAARVHGRFVHFGGLVYPRWPEWRTDRIDRELIRSSDIVVGIDPGARNFGLSWNAFDAFDNQIQFASAVISGDYHDYRPGDVHPEGANVAHAASEIKRVNDLWGLDHGKIDYVIDPAARARSAITSATIETEFQNLGINVMHGENDVEAGVLRIRRRGENGAFTTYNGPGNEAVQWEADRYRIEERDDGKFSVVKEDDHALDATRYASMHRAWDAPLDDVLDELLKQNGMAQHAPGIAAPPQKRYDPVDLQPSGPLV